MRPVGLMEVCDILRARPMGALPDARVEAVSTDTRNILPQSLFFAIRGPRFDGHRFVDIAFESGAVAAIVDDGDFASTRHDGRLLLVDNVVTALGRLAAWYRRSLAAQVVAVFGSNGKTTTKDLIHTVLKSRFRGCAAKNSFNNAIGVALTLLAASTTDEYVVAEVGTNAPGEIAALSRIVSPDFAVVTSIAEEHLEGFGSIEGVAAEEFSFLPNMTGRATVIMSEQAAAFAPRRMLKNYRVLTFGVGPDSALRVTDIRQMNSTQEFTINDRFEYELPLLGRHNVSNAMAAITVGGCFRMDHLRMADALKSAESPPMRLARHEFDSIVVTNDAYNANPGSMRAAFDTMDVTPTFGRKVFILGDMRELGTSAARCHELIGEAAGRSSAAVIITVGAYARHVADGAVRTAGTRKRIYSYPTVEGLAEKLPGLLQPRDHILLKASRGVRLEQLMPKFEAFGRENMTAAT